MLRAFALTVDQLLDPAILRVFVKSLAVTLLIFALLGVGLVYAVRAYVASQGLGETGGFVAATAAALGALLGAWLLFRAVAIPVLGFFADGVVSAIERKHFGAAHERAVPVSITRSARLGFASVGRLLGLNLLALPLYLVLMVTGIGPIILFIAANALLLGRDLGEMVAARHLSPTETKQWLRVTRGQRAVMGLQVTGILMIPVVNLIGPIIGAGLATHLFHRRQD